MKCGPHAGPRRRGSRGCFSSPCSNLGALHLTLCFNANSSFIISLLLTCVTWQGSLCNPFVTMATRARPSALWQKRCFTACLFYYHTFAMVTLHVAHVKGSYEIGVILIDLFLLSQFSHDCVVFISVKENQFPRRQKK